ncbi:uncharacterized protein LOC126790757 isoform X2 [Argentina anserina]|uniref:uncharacterized protein LOC126790757 isoform X2 n=1 Tax=Argentina anserina TaxID=57926 RepID=UPI0021762513|nr:uncharacterized protein LOC126790757 isoform X2 [Potentilla anserina]
MLPEDPLAQQKTVPNAMQGNGALSLPPMPGRKPNEDSGKGKSMRGCAFCGVMQGKEGPSGMCNACGFSYKAGRHCAEEVEDPEEPSIKSDKVKKRTKSDKVKKSIKGDEVKKSIESGEVKKIGRQCTHCGITKTPQWRMGPLGLQTLCNACGVRYKSGRLCPEYRPANSPTFLPELHSNLHRKVIQMRNQTYGIEGTMAKPVDNCTNSAATTAIVNILERPRRKVIAEKQSPVSVLEDNTKSSSTLESHQPPSKFLGQQQQLVSNQLNNKHNPEDTAKVEVETNTTTLMNSHGTIKLSYKVPSRILEQQQLFSCQPTNKRRKKNTVKLKNEGAVATLTSSCANLESPNEFLERQQLFNDQPNNNCNKKHTAIVEVTVKAVDICPTLMKSKKDSLPAVETSNILDHSRGHIIAEQRIPVLVLQNNTNNSATLMRGACETVELPHQSSSKIFREQMLFYNPANDNPDKIDTATVEIEGNITSTMSSCTTPTLASQAPNEFSSQQELFFNYPNINCNKKDTAIVEIETKCQNCGAKQSSQQWEGPIGPKILCLSCGLAGMAQNTARRKRSTPLASYKRCKKEDIAKVKMAVKLGDKCTNGTAALMNSKKDPFIDTLNISEKPNVVVIAEEQTPASVFGYSSMPLMSSTPTINPLNQAPSEFLGQQNQLCDHKNHKEKDAATVETEGNSSTLMRSSGTLELPNQDLNEILEQQQLLCKKAKNIPNKKDTARVEIKENSTTLMIPCGTSKAPYQSLSEFLGQQQLICNRDNNDTNKENAVNMENEGKCQNCGEEQNPRWLGSCLGPKTLCHVCGLAKFTALQQSSIAMEMPCPLPATKPSVIANGEHQKLFSAQENSTKNSTDLMSSCRITIPHRARSKGHCRRRSTIPSQQVGIGEKCVQCGKQTNRWRMGPLGPTTLCNACGNKYLPLWGISEVTVDITKCQHCGSREATQLLMSALGAKTLCAVCYHWIKYGRQQLCNQTNNNSDRKAISKVVTGRKCHHCGVEETALWRSGPMGSKTLCNACGLRWYKFGDFCRDCCASISMPSICHRKVPTCRSKKL